ncbi:DUF1223 domain-containing protein [Celeribacter sp.]|uniref:DUF1223 domain-containing protein n=1 Tax=Celeribacter sp. TaxID=1890673 RepID=UPI003A8CD4C6
MRQILTGLAMVALMTGGAQAQETAQPSPPLVVIELFTSQGCSSCPPADALMAELSDLDGILPLSLHVDYWDYIGWKDVFAQAQFTDRQRAYARAAGKRSIYTPQMIVQGVDHVVGFKPMKLVDQIKRRQSQLSQIPISLSVMKRDGMLEILAQATGALPPHMVVQLVRFDPHERVEIRRGENAGRVVDYTNIVTEWMPVADWNGKAPLLIEVPVTGPEQTAVVVQSRDAGAIVAAALAQ